jgi:hypothetical protein
MKRHVMKTLSGMQWVTRWIYAGGFKFIVGVSVVYKFQVEKNKIKLLMEYENVTQIFLFYKINKLKRLELHFQIP